MSFSRWWTEAVAALGDVVPLPLAALLVALAAGVVAAAWHWAPYRWRWPRRRRTARLAEAESLDVLAHEELPDLPPAAFTSLADRLAAAGDHAGAVRERLRAMVRELVDRGVVEHRPGWTVTELALAAGRARPAVSTPLREAGDIYSDLWYGQLPARPEHDARMRTLADDLQRALDPTRAATSKGQRS